MGNSNKIPVSSRKNVTLTSGFITNRVLPKIHHLYQILSIFLFQIIRYLSIIAFLFIGFTSHQICLLGIKLDLIHAILMLYVNDNIVFAWSGSCPACSNLSLRSAAHGDLTVPRTRSVRMGPRSFAVSSPELWNSLAPELKNPSISLDTFKSLLKTELFKLRAYPVVNCNSFLVTLFTQG